MTLVTKRSSPQTRFDPALGEIQAAGFPMGGEGLAVDLADTIVTVTHPKTDLIADQVASDLFWNVHAPQLPPFWAPPTVDRTREIRDAIRTIFDAVQQRMAIDVDAVTIVNESALLALPTMRAILIDGVPKIVEGWQCREPAHLAIAAAARSALDVLAAPESLKLRRCQSPTCSMLYVTGDARRRWCTPNICANRDRVARHYRRHHGSGGA